LEEEKAKDAETEEIKAKLEEADLMNIKMSQV
jgi:hypothetical protein